MNKVVKTSAVLLASFVLGSTVVDSTVMFSNSSNTVEASLFGNKKNKKYDKQFMKDFEKGLQKHWDISYVDDLKLSKSFYKKIIDVELKEIKDYKNKQFKSSALQEQVIAYINVLKEAKKVTNIYGSDEFDEKWMKVYDKRTSIIVKINKLHKIHVSKRYQDYLDELLGNGKAANKNTKLNDSITTLLQNTTFEAQPKDFPDDTFTTFEAVVKNTTGADITSLSAVVKLKDDDGVVLDTEYLNADQWLKNEPTRFEFMTDQDFTSTEVRVEYVDFK